MNLSILVFIFILIILYNTQGNIFKQISNINEYIIGIPNNKNIKNFMTIYLKYSDLNINIKIKLYENNRDLLKDLDNRSINFAITNENNILESNLGINNYTTKLENIRFITGLYYNYQYLLTNIIYKDKQKTIEITNVHDLKKFYTIYKRHLIIGTDEKNSESYMGLMVLLYMYGFNPVNIEDKDETKIYSDTTIFYKTYSIDNLFNNFNGNILDGIFVLNIYNFNKIRELIDKKDVLMLDITYKNTIFNDIYSNFYYDKTITISNYNNDLDSTYTFNTKTNRILLVANKNEDEKVVEKMMKTYFMNNNKIINTLIGSELDIDHTTFEPLDMIYINKYINIHKGSYNYMKELGFIIDEGTRKQVELNNNEHFKYYWKYDKIGLNKFILN